MEAVPIANLPVRDLKRLRRILLVVVKSTRTDAPLVVRVPDLHLRRTAEIKPRVTGDGHRAPVGPHLEVSVVLLRRKRITALVAVKVEVAVADGPMFVHADVGDRLHRRLFAVRGLLTDDRVVKPLFRRHAFPVRSELLRATVEIGLEAFRSLHALTRTDLAHLRVVRKLLDADVLPDDGGVVAAPAEVALGGVEAGVLFAVGRVGAVAAEAGEVGLGYEVAVDPHLDLLADHLDLLEVPHPRLAHVAAAAAEVRVLAPDLAVKVVAPRRDDSKDRARVAEAVHPVLLRLGVVVGAAAVVEHLDLAHAVVGRVGLLARHP